MIKDIFKPKSKKEIIKYLKNITSKELIEIISSNVLKICIEEDYDGSIKKQKIVDKKMKPILKIVNKVLKEENFKTVYKENKFIIDG